MSKEKQIHIEKNPHGKTFVAIGNGVPRPLTTVINCKNIILSQESIGGEVNVTEAFERTNTIIVNGAEFVKKEAPKTVDEQSDERKELIKLIFHTPVSSYDGRSKEELIANLVLNSGYRKQSEGKWIPSDIPQEKYVCSVCGGACWYYDYQGDVAKSRYCPNCGARMSGGKNE